MRKHIFLSDEEYTSVREGIENLRGGDVENASMLMNTVPRTPFKPPPIPATQSSASNGYSMGPVTSDPSKTNSVESWLLGEANVTSATRLSNSFLGKSLELCSSCQTAYYSCSIQCQRTVWKAGHKQACRKPKERRAGDAMLLIGLQKRPDFNGRDLLAPTQVL